MSINGAMIDQGLGTILERLTDRFYGKYRGIVSNTQDSSGLGRIKAKVPEILGTQETGWALPCSYAGNGEGLFAIPPVGAGVWIEFEAGDPSRPVWSGGWWGTGQVPQNQKSTTATPTMKILRSSAGLLIALDDNGQSIAISDKSGSNLVTIDANAGTITVQAGTLVVTEAPSIKHGQGAGHPEVWGDILLSYLNTILSLFNSHMHPGELAAGFLPVTPMLPVPQFTPPPTMLSSKVLLE